MYIQKRSRVSITLVLSFLVIFLIVFINPTISMNQTLENQTLVNETSDKTSENVMNATNATNETLINETFANETLETNNTLENQTFLNETLLNETLKINETLENQTSSEISNFWSEKIKPALSEIDKKLESNEIFGTSSNESFINRTLTNETLSLNITETNTNESLANETFLNETLEITDETVKIRNETFANETLETNETLKTQTSSETLTNETLEINETLKNQTSSETLTDATLENVTSETLENETSSETLIPLYNESIKVESNLILNSILLPKAKFENQKLYLGCDVQDLLMKFSGVILGDSETYLIDATIWDDTGGWVYSDTVTTGDGVFSLEFYPKPNVFYDLKLTVLDPEGDKTEYDYKFSIQNPLPPLFADLSILRPSIVYPGVPFNVTVTRIGGVSENYSLSITSSFDNLKYDFYNEQSVKQTYIIEDYVEKPVITILYQDEICVQEGIIELSLASHLKLTREILSKIDFDKELKIELGVQPDIPLYNLTVKEFFDNEGFEVQNTFPEAIYTNTSIIWHIPSLDKDTALSYTLLPIKSGNYTIGPATIDYEVIR